MRPVVFSTLFLVALGGACRTPDPTNSDGTWVGTITTEGDVTTVVNESGSVWGGTARLVEEASIGVENGADEYLFGYVGGVWATEDRIYVVDTQVPVVRVYDLLGVHLFDIGRRGEGPGEYESPWGIATNPTGEIIVSGVGDRLNVYAPDGTPLQTFNLGTSWQFNMPNMFMLSSDGVPYKIVADIANPTPSGFPRTGMQAFGSEGALGEPMFPPSLGFEPWCLEVGIPSSGGTYPWCAIPFAPHENTALTPDLDWVVGTNDTYTFQVHHPDGRLTRVSRPWEPVRVSAEEADYHRRRTIADLRQRDPGWTWSGPAIPEHKPAYTRFLPDRSGRVWLVREGPSRRQTGDCTDDFSDPDAVRRNYRPCWVATTFLDAFDADGRYLGELELPQEAVVSMDVYIRGDVVVAPAWDEAGTIMVKRYRLVLPGEAGK